MNQELQKQLDETFARIGRLVQEGKPIPFESFTSEDYKTLYTIGYGLYEAGDAKQAKHVFHQLVLAKPLQSEYWFGMGCCLQMLKQYEQALSAWAMCSLLDGHNPIPHFHAGECYMAMQEAQEARKAFRLFVHMAKNEPQYADLVKKTQVLVQEIASGRSSS